MNNKDIDIFSEKKYTIIRYAYSICIIILIVIAFLLYIIKINDEHLLKKIIDYYLY